MSETPATKAIITTPTAIQQLRELTGVPAGSPLADDGDALLRKYRSQYTLGWNIARREGTTPPEASEAEHHGHGDFTCGLPKWMSLAETGLLG